MWLLEVLEGLGGCGGLWRVVEAGMWMAVEAVGGCRGFGGLWNVVERRAGFWRFWRVWEVVEGCGGLWRLWRPWRGVEGCEGGGGFRWGRARINNTPQGALLPLLSRVLATAVSGPVQQTEQYGQKLRQV